MAQAIAPGNARTRKSGIGREGGLRNQRIDDDGRNLAARLSGFFYIANIGSAGKRLRSYPEQTVGGAGVERIGIAGRNGDGGDEIFAAVVGQVAGDQAPTGPRVQRLIQTKSSEIKILAVGVVDHEWRNEVGVVGKIDAIVGIDGHPIDAVISGHAVQRIFVQRSGATEVTTGRIDRAGHLLIDCGVAAVVGASFGGRPGQRTAKFLHVVPLGATVNDLIRGGMQRDAGIKLGDVQRSVGVSCDGI